MFDKLTGGMDAIKDATGAFSNISGLLGGITDQASAEAAAPELEEATSALDGLASKLGALPGPIKSQVSGKVEEYSAQFEDLAGKLTAIPGVSGVVEPHLNKIREIIGSFG